MSEKPLGRFIPGFVRAGTFTEEWRDAPNRGDTVEVRLEFTADLDAGDGEQWSAALLRGRASATDETQVTALMMPISKLPPRQLVGQWNVKMARRAEGEPWQLVEMRRRG